MVEAIELTYENMKQFCIDYFGQFPATVEEAQRPLDEGKMREFFAPDSKVIIRYSRDDVCVLSGEQWVKRISGKVPEFFCRTSWDTPPLGIIIDERRKMAVQLIEEAFMSPVTGEPMDPREIKGFEVEKSREYRIVVWEFCIHDNKVKAKSELIMRPLVDPL